MSAELKDCPFCGGVAFMVQEGTHAQCLTPGCCIGPASSVDSWNARAPQWLPIESAPRDGSWVVLGRAGHDAVLLAFWHRLHSAWWGQGGGDGSWKKWQQATHWMPLPAPPEASHERD